MEIREAAKKLYKRRKAKPPHPPPSQRLDLINEPFLWLPKRQAVLENHVFTKHKILSMKVCRHITI